MGKFQINQLTAKDTSTITGSLSVLGSITGSVYMTASNVVTSSYALNVITASYTTASLTPTSSYTTFALSSSISITASIVQGPVYAPTVGMGYVSPNYYMGTPEVLQTITTAYYPGVIYSPFIATRNYTVTTMSIVGGNGSGAAAIITRAAIYSESITGYLPQFLLAQASASVPSNAGLVQVIHMPIVTPITLVTNNVYWIAFAAPTNYRLLIGNSHAAFSSINPLLGPRYSTQNTLLLANNLISSGSNLNATFVSTASQAITDYRSAPNQQLPTLMPVLKVTY